MNYRNNKLNAFTLVELAIVIVIIGLLVGGVLGGAELIRVAKLNSIVSDLKAIEAAAILYKDKYKRLPGDDSKALDRWPNCANGNRVCTAGNDDQAMRVPFTETPLAHLIAAGLLKDKPCNWGTQDYYGTSIEGLCIVLAGPPATPVRIWGIPNGTFMQLNSGNGSLLTPEDARYIDSKLDDGIPSSGVVIGFGSGAITSTTCLNNNDYQNPPTGSINYNLNSSAKDCAMRYLFNSL